MGLMTNRSKESMQSKIQEITKQIHIINSISGDIIDYSTATEITHNLSDLRTEYQKALESK